MQQQYFLKPHVHLCITDDHVVLLDLQRDKYIGIGPSQTEMLASKVKGWPGHAEWSVKQMPDGSVPADGSLAKMLENGMLTTDPAIGKEAQPLAMPRPETTLTEADLEARPNPTCGQIANFLSASVTARLSLRWRPIHAVVARTQRRKKRHAAVAGLDVAKARELVDAFLYLRPLLFGARDECLYDSLALIEFLARYEIFPTWVFGVQTRPFLAHSWVQHKDIVFNDTPDYVHRFTPILAI